MILVVVFCIFSTSCAVSAAAFCDDPIEVGAIDADPQALEALRRLNVLVHNDAIKKEYAKLIDFGFIIKELDASFFSDFRVVYNACLLTKRVINEFNKISLNHRADISWPARITEDQKNLGNFITLRDEITLNHYRGNHFEFAKDLMDKYPSRHPECHVRPLDITITKQRFWFAFYGVMFVDKKTVEAETAHLGRPFVGVACAAPGHAGDGSASFCLD